jgi:hypothetical protein
MVINRIAPFSLAKISGTLYAVLGLIFGALFSLVAMAGLAAGAGNGNSMFGALFGVGAIILFPIFYGCIGFVASLIGAWLYNVLAGMVGGVELDVT